MIDLQQLRFHYRVAGVAAHGGRVLLHRSENDDFWNVPGGRTRPLESSAAALRREMRKELGAEVTVVRLLWVVKNFFRDQGEAHHELGLYFLMSLDPGSHLYSHDGPFPGDEEGLALEFQWYPQKQSVLMHLPVSPAFLQRGLTSLPNVPQHVVHYDPDF